MSALSILDKCINMHGGKAAHGLYLLLLTTATPALIFHFLCYFHNVVFPLRRELRLKMKYEVSLLKICLYSS